MDRTHSRSMTIRLHVACLLISSVGCVANPVPIPTFWDKLGIPQATAILRDSTINRSGKFPNWEKKPPLLKLADPANLAPEKPEMIKAAAKIKAEKDLSKQKIKALKFLADVNCGCYNKDDSVAKAFLAALDDCDPDVRKAAIEGLSKAAGNCSQCRTGCETTCCTEDIVNKLQDIATGMDDKGCFKEPVKDIRNAAAALVRKCPCPTPKPLEEIPAPAEIEELTTPESFERIEGGDQIQPMPNRREGDSASNSRRVTKATGVALRLQESTLIPGTEPVMIAKRTVSPAKPTAEISNPDQLILVRVVSSNKQLGEVLLELSEVYQLSQGWTMVAVDESGKHQTAKVMEASGRRILLAFDSNLALSAEPGQMVKLGLITK